MFPDKDIVQFREMWTREQCRRVDKIILERDLTVYILPPRQVFFASKDSLIFDYGVPLLRDVLPGKECIVTLSKIKTSQTPQMTWDRYIIGSRKDDSHELLGSVIPSEHFELNGMKFWAPFYDWTREMVIEKSIEYGLDVSPISEMEDSGNYIGLCTRCLDTSKKTTFCPAEGKRIPTIQWHPELNRQTLRFL